MTNRSVSTGVPVWVRVPGVIVLVLLGILVSAVLAGAAGVGGGAGPDKHPTVQRDNPEQPGASVPPPGPGGGHRPPKGGH